MFHILHLANQNCLCPPRNSREGGGSDSCPFILTQTRCWHQASCKQSTNREDAVSVSQATTRHHLMFVEIDREKRFWESPPLALQQKFHIHPKITSRAICTLLQKFPSAERTAGVWVWKHLLRPCLPRPAEREVLQSSWQSLWGP